MITFPFTDVINAIRNAKKGVEVRENLAQMGEYCKQFTEEAGQKANAARDEAKGYAAGAKASEKKATDAVAGIEQTKTDAVQAVLLSLREVERKTVIFEDGNQVYRFSPREILFVEILNRTLIVVRARDSIRLRATITMAEELLVPFGFIRIHKSYLVNYRAIFTIGKKDVLLEDGRALPISKHRYREVLQQFMQLHRKEDEEVET